MVDLEGHGREDIGRRRRPVAHGRLVHHALPGARSSAARGLRGRVAQGDQGAAAERAATAARLRRAALPARGRRPCAALAAAAPQIVFNYLGQFDQVIAGSALFALRPRVRRSVARPARAPHARARSPRAGRRRQARGPIGSTAEAPPPRRPSSDWPPTFSAAAAQTSSSTARRWKRGGYTPSDFPLARLDQAERSIACRRRVPRLEDVYPLSPMQRLFYSMDGSAAAGLEQWHSVLRGRSSRGAARAWSRSSRATPSCARRSSAGLREPLQVVHRAPCCRGAEQDWRGLTPARAGDRDCRRSRRGSRTGFDLATAAADARRAVRVGRRACQLVWSTHHLLHRRLVLAAHVRGHIAASTRRRRGARARRAARCGYRRYIDWLGAQDSRSRSRFWRDALRGFTPDAARARRTPARSPGRRRTVRRSSCASCPSERPAALQALCREHQLTLSTLVQAAWALLLGTYSGQNDVVFGAAFSGRPARARASRRMVGPCVNNLPVRVACAAERAVRGWLTRCRQRSSSSSEHQYTPLDRIQELERDTAAQPPVRQPPRVPELLADDATRRLGRTLAIRPAVRLRRRPTTR